MISFPNCKINLGLHVIARNPDGYHELETVFYPLPAVHDMLEIIRADGPATTLAISGLPVPGDVESNLCIKAYELLKKDFSALPSLSAHLHKVIPMGAGLGGGSADGAAMLQLMNDCFHLGLPVTTLQEYAAKLGSDCAFFILNSPCIAGGRGDVLHPVSLDLSPYSLLLVCPPVHVDTAWAYRQIVPQRPQQRLEEIISTPVTQWPGKLVNHFEEPVFRAHPEIKEIRQRLYDAGAYYAAMSGSGSAVFGIFGKNKIADLRWESGYQLFVIP